jgi:hypothetical protein
VSHHLGLSLGQWRIGGNQELEALPSRDALLAGVPEARVV